MSAIYFYESPKLVSGWSVAGMTTEQVRTIIGNFVSANRCYKWDNGAEILDLKEEGDLWVIVHRRRNFTVGWIRLVERDRVPQVIVESDPEDNGEGVKFIADELKQFIEATPTEPATMREQEQDTTPTKPGKAGRHPDALYEQAYNKIAKGENKDAVFAWYCAEVKNKEGADISGDGLARESFDAAMRRRRRN